MKSLHIRRGVAAGALAAAVVVGGGTAAAVAAPSGPASQPLTPAQLTDAIAGSQATTAQPTSTEPAATRPVLKGPHHRRIRPWLRRELGILGGVDHGTFEVKRAGKWVTLTFDRGTLESATSSALVIARPDGQSTTIALTGTTRFRGVAGEQALVTHRPVAVISQGGRALIVAQPKPGAHPPARPAAPANPQTGPAGA